MLSTSSRHWPAARRLLLRLVDCAESSGARLSLRFRETFARHAADTSLLPDLARRGHEVGAHAHGRGLSAAVQALQACGLTPTVAAPGLVQAGSGGRSLLIHQAAALGITLLTDHSAQRAWAYEGLLPRPEHGVQVAAPTVRPFDWGLMSRDGTRHGITASSTARLRALESQAASHGTRWFGWTFHEHDLCTHGSLDPRPEALDALTAHLDARVIPARAATTAEAPPPRILPRRPPSDRRIRLARVVSMVAGHATGALPRRPRLRARIPLRRPAVNRIHLQGRALAVTRHDPADARVRLLLSHAGPEGGCRLGLTPFGLDLSDLTRRGWSVWFYDRSGTGRSAPGPASCGWRAMHPLAPGNPAHTDDWRAVLSAARAEPLPIVALSWSSGIIPVLLAAAAGERPDALVDGESPSDRWSLVPPRPNELAALDPWDDLTWAGWEPVPLMASLRCPYARIQAEQDHVHGRMHEHSRRMVAAAAASGLVHRPPALLAGRIHAHPSYTLQVLEWAAELAINQRR